MKLHFTNEWLKQGILNDLDLQCEIGPELEDATPFSNVRKSQQAAEQKQAASETSGADDDASAER
jgi:hypothetical protein